MNEGLANSQTGCSAKLRAETRSKHLNLVNEIAGLNHVIERLRRLFARISGSEREEKPDVPLNMPEPALLELLVKGPETISRIRSEAIEAINEIEALLFE